MDYEDLPPDYKNSFSRYIRLMNFIGLNFFDDSNGFTNSKKRLCVFNMFFLPFLYTQFRLLTKITADNFLEGAQLVPICLVVALGLDFFDDSNGFTNSKKRLFVFNIFFLPFLCTQFRFIAKITADNFLEGAQVVPVCLMFALDMIKMTTAVVKKSELKEIFLEIGELWPRGLDDDDETTIVMRNWMRRMGLLVNAFFIYAVVNLTVFETIPFLLTCYKMYIGVNEYVFPFQVLDLWPVDSTISYVLTYMWVLSGTIPCQLCLYLPYDLLIVIITSNVSILLRLLQIDLTNSIKTYNSQGRKNMSVSDPESCEEICRIVKKHQELLRIAKKLSDIFGFVIFIHVAFSAVVICFFGFLTVVFGGLAETIANLLTVWNTVITIFLLSLSGQLLCDTSSNVGDAAYKSLWYESDMKTKRLVLFIIIRSQRASYLSALGFSDINLRSFSKIMSSAWTYFSLLIQMYEEN